MGIAVSLLLVAAGAIMRFAVTVQGHGFNVHTTGLILMTVGGVGVLLSLIFWSRWGGFSRRPAAVAATPARPFAAGGGRALARYEGVGRDRNPDLLCAGSGARGGDRPPGY